MVHRNKWWKKKCESGINGYERITFKKRGVMSKEREDENGVEWE